MAQEYASRVAFDRTITAEILKLLDRDTGKYSVQYNGTAFPAYSEDLEATYEKGDNVYVIVPEGNLSGKKLIKGYVNNKTLTDKEISNLQNQWLPVGPTFGNIYDYDEEVVRGVIAGKKYNSELNSYNFIYPSDKTYEEVEIEQGKFDSNMSANIAFNLYSKQYEYIRISGEFLTALQSEHKVGNYGIKVTFYTKDKDEQSKDKTPTISFKLDSDVCFNGQVYNFVNYAYQSMVFKVQKDFLIGLKSVELYEENFEYDKVRVGVNPDDIFNEVWEINSTEQNIFVKNIQVQFVEPTEYLNQTYFLRIKTPNGVQLSEDRSYIKLEGQLLSKNVNIMSEDSCICQWYEQDLSIISGDEEGLFNKNAGYGWRPVLSEDKDDKYNIFTIYRRKPWDKRKYKLVCIYNETVITSAEVEIDNAELNLNCSIEQEVIRTDTIDRTHLTLNWETDKEEYKNLVGQWYILYPDGFFSPVLDVNGNPYGRANSIDIQHLVKFESLTFFCAVFKAEYNQGENQVALDNLSYLIQDSSSSSDLNVFFTGQDFFTYDANGDISIEDSEKERRLYYRLVWEENKTADYTVQWLDPFKQPITNTRDEVAYMGSGSMIDKVWIDINQNLHYTVKQKHNFRYINNSFYLLVTTIDGREYLFEKPITFRKDGEQGTNGTTFSVAIRPVELVDNQYMQIGSQFYPIRVYPNSDYRSIKSIEPINLQAFVYYNGEIINDPRLITNGKQRFEFTYQWECPSNKLTLTQISEGNEADIRRRVNINIGQNFPFDEFNQNSINHKADSFEYIVKLHVKIKDNQPEDNVRTESELWVHYIYPVSIYVNANQEGSNRWKRILYNNFPTLIQYTSGGFDPKLEDDLDIQFVGDGIDNKNIDSGVQIASFVKSLDEKIIGIDQRIDKDTGEVIKTELDVNSKFEGIQKQFGVITGQIEKDNKNEYYIQPVVFFLNTFSNRNINNWDGQSIDINEEEKYIYAPQVGAGRKDENNQFSGVVMGIKANDWDGGIDSHGEVTTGLYGFKEGVNTFGLMENGVAYFGGPTAGRIWIDGVDGKIEGGNGGNASWGMTINLWDKGQVDIDESSKSEFGTAIKLGDGNFEVKYDGTVYANKGVFGGKRENSSNTWRDNDAWIIETGRLYSGSSNSYVELNSNNKYKSDGNTSLSNMINPFSIWAGKTYNTNYKYLFPISEFTDRHPRDRFENYSYLPPFAVTKDGFLYARGAYFEGELETKIGYIGEWIINDYGLDFQGVDQYGDKRTVFFNYDQLYGLRKISSLCEMDSLSGQFINFNSVDSLIINLDSDNIDTSTVKFYSSLGEEIKKGCTINSLIQTVGQVDLQVPAQYNTQLANQIGEIKYGSYSDNNSGLVFSGGIIQNSEYQSNLILGNKLIRLHKKTNELRISNEGVSLTANEKDASVNLEIENQGTINIKVNKIDIIKIDNTGKISFAEKDPNKQEGIYARFA